MKLKNVLVFCVIIFSLNNINAEEQKLKNYNAIEFLIGGGLNHSILIKLDDCTYYEEFEMNARSLSLYQSIYLSIPISFLYYPNKYFAIGVTSNFGAGIDLHTGYSLLMITVCSKLLVSHKIGNTDKGKYFLIEYGINSTGRYFPLPDKKVYFFRYSFKTSFDTIYCFGPSLLLGFEMRTKKGLSFSIGQTIDYGFSKQIYGTGYHNYSYINIGIETRLRYSYLKILKSK